MSLIWQQCQGTAHIGRLKTTAVRIVESQEQIATMALVDTADEQHILEQLLDRTKPAPPPGAEGYHYLIWTPFRYPPLPHGSRFGLRDHTGIFYASLAIPTALAECAYYRFVFLSGLSAPPPRDRLTTEHTTFEVQVDTPHGIPLDKPPFNEHEAAISDARDYRAAQQLGSAMRDAGVGAFTYRSARGPGTNVAAFSIKAIKSRRPKDLRQWICTTTSTHVAFTEVHTNESPQSFTLDSFLIDNSLPTPAC